MRVLVAVASRHGATREIGDEVAQVLARAGHTVDVLRPDDVERVDGYGAVVLGSAMYLGRGLPSLRALVRRCADDLARVPVWVFWSGPVGVPRQPTGEPPEPAESVRLLRDVHPRAVTTFGGRLSTDGLGIGERALVRMIGAEPGDHRDVAAIDRWAAGIAGGLAREPVGAG